MNLLTRWSISVLSVLILTGSGKDGPTAPLAGSFRFARPNAEVCLSVPNYAHRHDQNAGRGERRLVDWTHFVLSDGTLRESADCTVPVEPAEYRAWWKLPSGKLVLMDSEAADELRDDLGFLHGREMQVVVEVGGRRHTVMSLLASDFLRFTLTVRRAGARFTVSTTIFYGRSMCPHDAHEKHIVINPDGTTQVFYNRFEMDEDIPPGQLRTASQLTHYEGGSMKSLRPLLRHRATLRSLALFWEGRDLTPLSRLKNVRELSLCGEVADVEPLLNLSKLETLELCKKLEPEQRNRLLKKFPQLQLSEYDDEQDNPEGTDG